MGEQDLQETTVTFLERVSPRFCGRVGAGSQGSLLRGGGVWLGLEGCGHHSSLREGLQEGRAGRRQLPGARGLS